MEITNQKEYLRKYLSSSGKEGKKKKKRKPISGERVTIIDDDIDISQLQTAQEAIDLFHTNEDAPQVVGVVDERPMHLRVKDYTDSDLWKPLGEQTNGVVESAQVKTSFQIKNKSEGLLQLRQLSIKKDKGPRLGKPNESSVLKQNEKSVSESNSLKGSSFPQKSADSSLQRSYKDTDSSPPRKTQTSMDLNTSKQIRKNSDDSPPRRIQKSVDSSPPRKSRKGSDNSPPRKLQKSADSSPPRCLKDSDQDPPRKTQRSSDSSPPRRSRKTSVDNSPLKSNPERKPTHSPLHRKTRDLSPPRKKHSEDTEVKRKMLPGDKRGKYLIPAKRQERMAKTLDGKTAGLQNAQELVKETQEFRNREDDLFKNMDAQVSGVNATTIIRDRKTGKIRDFAKEAEERKEKQKREEETKEKYMQWGKGLKQVEDYNDKLAQDLLEMSKPLARYADDEDLEKYLKEREREEDPMLQYIRRKKKKIDIETNKPSKPEYMGEFMPNRYGIVPGHRWDGVDRSNGYEQKWLETQNARRAIMEDVYKWSTEDM